MKNAREMERDLRQQLANMEVEFSEQSGQLAAMMERIRRQEELTAAGTHPHPHSCCMASPVVTSNMY